MRMHKWLVGSAGAIALSSLIMTSKISAGDFRSTPFIQTIGSVFTMATGDLNADHKSDLVYFDNADQSLHVRISTGNDSFQDSTYDLGIFVRSIAIEDVNQDGRLDIVAGGNMTFTGYVAVLLGNGDGTFQSPIFSVATSGQGNFPLMGSIGVADFNEDGKLDLVVSDRGNGVLSFLSGDGTGHFQLQSSWRFFNDPRDIIVADIDHDNHMDFLVVDPLGGDLFVYKGDGDGTFQAPVRYTTPHLIRSAVLADVNGDGEKDLVVAGDNYGVDILLGSPDGTFTLAELPEQILYGGSLGSVSAVLDIDGDGNPDIVITSRNGIAVLFGNGSLTFLPPVIYSAVTFPQATVTGDFNGNGQVGFGVSSFVDNHIAILSGQGRRSFDGARAYDVGSAISSVAVADVNGDFFPDIVAATDRDTVSSVLGNGDGTFQMSKDPIQLFSVFRPGSVNVADFDGDGIPDVLLNNQSGQPFASGAIQFGNGDGSFQIPTRALEITAAVPCAYVADLNNDQISDILVGHYTFLGNGDGTFQTPEGFQASTGCPPLLADVNGDGILDLVEASTTGIRVMLGNGDGSFQPPIDSGYPLPNPPVDMAAADLNGDGIPDLVVTISFRNFAELLFGNGDGTFGSPVQLPTALQETRVAIGDLDGDGKQDLVFSNAYVLSILRGNGDGTFQSPIDYLAGHAPGKPILVDVNNDGKVDIVVPPLDVNATTAVTVLLNGMP